jgi:hypothetical protein
MHSTLIHEAAKAAVRDRVRKAETASLLAPEHRSGRPRRLVIPLLGVSTLAACALGFSGTSLAALPASCTQAGDTVTCKFAYTGSEQNFVVPAGVHSVQVAAVGARGGNGDSTAPGGAGGTASGVLAVTPGELLYLEVGGAGEAFLPAGAGFPIGSGGAGGWNGGGSGAPSGSGGGGGASDVRTTSCGSNCPGSLVSLASRLLVAAGGGGGGAGAANSDTSGTGGTADSAGGDAFDTFDGTTPTGAGGHGGQPGTLDSGGAGGAGSLGQVDATPSGTRGHDGTFGQGGAGSGNVQENALGQGGGGGAGWYGGGGGGSGPTTDETIIPQIGGGGGGGGSSYAPRGTTGVAAADMEPSVTITYGLPAASPSTRSLTFGTQPQSTVSPSQKVTITDSGDASLRVSGLRFSGPNAGDFLVTSNNCQGDELDPGASCEVNVAFAPQDQGSRSATLNIETSDPDGPATVALSGTGGQLPQGPAGPQGQPGPQGQTGPQGPQGPPGKVVCRNVAAATLTCSLLFQPGTWTTAAAPKTATVAVDRHGHRVLSRHVRIRHGRMTVQLGHRLRPGRYVVTITVSGGHRRATLLRRQITIRPAG